MGNCPPRNDLVTRFFNENSRVDQVVVFDGVCNFCNGWVSFVTKRDPKNRFAFAAAQSGTGRMLLEETGYLPESLETILLVSRYRTYSKSDAVLKILAQPGGLWRLVYALTLIPRPIRDFLYTAVARNRYSIAGRRNVCEIPTCSNGSKFLS